MTITNYLIREDFLENIYNKGVMDFPKIKHLVSKNKRGKGIKDFQLIVDLVIAAEKENILYIRSTKDFSRKRYCTTVRWYLGQLQRKGRINNFLHDKVGRPMELKLK